MPSWYTSELGSAGNQASEAGYQQEKATFGCAGNLASEAGLSHPHPQGAILGCVGSSGESEREWPLPSSEAMSPEPVVPASHRE